MGGGTFLEDLRKQVFWRKVELQLVARPWSLSGLTEIELNDE